MNDDWKQLWRVTGAGAIGGLLAWIYAEAIGTPLELEGLGAPLASVCLGAGAAILGVYVIAKTDTSATLHALAFAMACGFAWKPVMEGSTSLVVAQIAQATQATIDEETDAAVASSEALTADTADDATLDEAVSSATEALRHDPPRADAVEERSARLEDVVDNIRSANKLSLQARIDALGRIGSAATQAGDQSLAAISLSAIAELGGDARASKKDKERAAQKAAEIGEKGERRRMPALQVSSDVIGEAMRVEPQSPVKEIFDRRFSRLPRQP